MANALTLLSRALFLRSQPLADALPRLGGKLLRHGFSQLVTMLMGGTAQKADLFAVTPAPLANEQMQPQSQAF